MKKLKLLLDIDEVVCFSGFLEMVNDFLHTNYKIDDFTDYYIDLAAIPKEKMDEFNKYIRDINPYQHPVFLPHALEGLKEISKYYEIYPCSNCLNPADMAYSGNNFKYKYDLLYTYIPDNIIPPKNYILTGTKNLFKVDAQVDDLLSNIDEEIPLKILFPSYHNKNITRRELENRNILKAGDSWQEGWEHLVKILIDYALKEE